MGTWTTAQRAVAAAAIECPAGTKTVEAYLGYERGNWCVRKDGVRDGPYILWYDVNRKKEQGAFAAGKRVGEWKSWSPEGKPVSQGVYADDVRFGKWVTWFSNGQVEQVTEYMDGVASGDFVLYYKNGNKAEEGRMQNGYRIGPWTFWYENGKPMKQGSFKGVVQRRNDPVIASTEDGRWTFWYPDGRKQAEGSYKYWGRDGVWSEYDEKGRERTVRYVGGVPADQREEMKNLPDEPQPQP